VIVRRKWKGEGGRKRMWGVGLKRSKRIAVMTSTRYQIEEGVIA
jgi:hypothetical protein